jgi:hypothetical protein
LPHTPDIQHKLAGMSQSILSLYTEGVMLYQLLIIMGATQHAQYD